jgi:hypothetical protein
MATSDDTFNRRLASILLVSLIFSLGALALRLGLDRTSYEAMDSAGRTMGFNDRFGAEHYAIIFRNFVVADLFKTERLYEWALLAMQVLGIVLVWRRSGNIVRHTRRFFAAQILVFPLAVPGLIIAPLMITSIVTGQADRESFVDLPFFVCTAQPVWLLASLTMVLGLRGPGLGLSKIGPALKGCAGFLRQRLA